MLKLTIQKASSKTNGYVAMDKVVDVFGKEVDEGDDKIENP